MIAALAEGTLETGRETAQNASFWGGAVFWALLAAAVVVGVLVAWRLYRGRRNGAAKGGQPIPPTAMAPAEAPNAGGAVTVSKLHEIGKRERQEDSLSVSPEEMLATHGLLAVLADGMGGLSDGDVVSSRIVSSVMEAFIHEPVTDAERTLCALLLKANRDVLSSLEPSQYGKCGSTLAMGLLREGRFHYLSVGDSIICLVRGGQVLRLNRAHIYQNELYLRAVNGDIGLTQCTQSRMSASLVSFLGMESLRYIDLPAEPVDVEPGDRFILMSDGVYNALTKREISDALCGSPEGTAARLKQKIEEKNYAGQDNYTAIVLSV